MIAAVHLAAAVAFTIALQGWSLAAVLCALTASGALGFAALRRGEACVWVLAANGDLSTNEADGDRLLRLQGSSTDFGWAIWLQWRDAASGRRGARMLTRDQFEPDEWRRLRVWLRHVAIVGEQPEALPPQR